MSDAAPSELAAGSASNAAPPSADAQAATKPSNSRSRRLQRRLLQRQGAELPAELKVQHAGLPAAGSILGKRKREDEPDDDAQAAADRAAHIRPRVDAGPAAVLAESGVVQSVAALAPGAGAGAAAASAAAAELNESKDSKEAKEVKAVKALPFKHRFIVAPMVDASDLAFRMLCRAYNADACFTPMFYADKFVADEGYRRECWSSCEGDRPLIVQFAANDPDVLLAAAKLVENKCDAVDINLGCPLREAKEKRFGSYLLDEHEHECVLAMVRRVSAGIRIPLTCKIRLLPSLQQTVDFALKLEEAGCAMLTVHARLRTRPRDKRAGPANLDHVTVIKQALRIPVITNGNTRSWRDVQRNLSLTRADGLMSAEGILANPALFANQKPDSLLMALEYLTYAEKYAAPLPWALRHVDKMCRHLFPQLGDGLRETFDKSESIEAARRVLVSCMVRRDAIASSSAAAAAGGGGSGSGGAGAGRDLSLQAQHQPRKRPRARLELGSGQGLAMSSAKAAGAGAAGSAGAAAAGFGEDVDEGARGDAEGDEQDVYG